MCVMRLQDEVPIALPGELPAGVLALQSLQQQFSCIQCQKEVRQKCDAVS